MIDNLPNGWKIEELGNMNLDISDGNYSSLYPTQNEFIEKGIPFIRANNISKNTIIDEDMRFISEDKHAILKKGQLKQNDLLFTNRGIIGQVGIVPDKYIGANINAQIVRINSGNKFTNKYLMYCFLKQELKNQMTKLETGSTLKQLPIRQLKKLNIPIPPLEQQEKIVKVLDLTSNLIEKQKELLEKYDLFLKSKFIEMFGDPISNPMGWENDVLSNVCPNKGDFVDGPFGSDLKVSDRTDEGIRIIQINNVGENEFRDKNKAFIRQEKYLTLKRHEVLQNDIIIAKMGEPIARSCFLPKHIDKAIIVADCMRMRITNNDYNRVFICFYLNFYTTKVLIDNLSHGSTRTRINLSILKTLEIIKPKVELQNKFALIVEKIETIKEKENQKLKQFEDLHNSMMNKAFKGEIK